VTEGIGDKFDISFEKPTLKRYQHNNWYRSPIIGPTADRN